MKKILLLFSLFVLVASPCFATGTWDGKAVTKFNGGAVTSINGVAISGGCDDTTGMLVAQDFTTGSLPSGWTEAVSGMTYNYTPALRGTYSAYSASTATSMTYVDFAGSGTIYFHVLVKITWPTGNGKNMIWIKDVSDNDLAVIQINADGTSYGMHGSAGSTGYTAMASGTTYHLWGRYTKGTTAGILTTWLGTTVNKGEATQNLNITTGSANVDAARFGIGILDDLSAVFDQIRVKTTDFTSVCP